MQHIVAGNNVTGDDVCLGHFAINVSGAHLQTVCHAAHAEDDKVQNLVVHFIESLVSTAKVRIKTETTNKLPLFLSPPLYTFSFRACFLVGKALEIMGKPEGILGVWGCDSVCA